MSYFAPPAVPYTPRSTLLVSGSMTIEESHALLADALRPRFPRDRAFTETPETVTPRRRRPSLAPPRNYDHLFEQIMHGNAMRRTLHRIPESKFVDEDTPDELIRDNFRRKSYVGALSPAPRQFDDGFTNEPLF
ncbi:hypothetical protein C8R43DRAFT_1132768 [Mycena crocata]|nr:hypothetical protein C8R43DRAFT_1132768 [Mycena crocata]